MAVAVLTEMNSESKKTSIAASVSTQDMNPRVLCGIGSKGTEGNDVFRDSRADVDHRRPSGCEWLGDIVVVVSSGRDLPPLPPPEGPCATAETFVYQAPRDTEHAATSRWSV